MPGLRERGPDRMPVHLGHRCSLRRSQLALGLSGRNNELHQLLLALQLSLHPLRLPGLGSSLLQERSQGYKTHRRHSNRICSSAASTFLLFMAQHYNSIREHNRSLSFRVPLLPQGLPLPTVSSFFVLFMGPGFAQVSLPILKSMGPLTPSKGFQPMISASLFIALFYFLFSLAAMLLFGELLLKYDTVIKVFYHASHSVLSSLLQLMAIFMTVFHTPVLIF